LIARYLILTTLDEAWRTHLYNLDDLKGGIGWTAYGGTDPLVAFKRESFVLFQEMLARTAEKIVRILLNPRLTVKPAGSPKGRERKINYLHLEGEGPTPQQDKPKPRRPVKVGKKPGRNDPCPCGSGKKYKNCCGRNQ